MCRKPGAAALAVASLALAIGFSTAAFSVLDAYSLRDLPVADPGGLVWVYANTREHRPDILSWPEYLLIAGRARSFTGVLAQDRRGPRVRLADRDDFPITAGVSDNFFDVAGVGTALGRVFHTGNGQDGTVVLSYRYWRDALGGDPAALGRDLVVGATNLRIIGILPPGFTGMNRGIAVDLFVPSQTFFGALAMARPNDQRFSDYEVLGRLRPGVTAEQARTEVEALFRQAEADGQAAGPARTAAVEAFAEKGLAPRLKSNAVMLGVMLLVILIAAANLANLRLVENEARRRETGIRLALGAGRADLARRHVTEAVLVSSLGAAAGLVLARWLVRLAPALLYAGKRYIDYHIRLDARVFAFSALALVLVALIGAAIPLTDAWRRRLLPVLQSSRTGAPSRWLGALVVSQMALVTGVTCSAGLLWRSLDNVAAIRPAMDPDRSLLLVEGAWEGRPRTADAAAWIGRVPGVEQVAWARRAMLAGSLGGATVGLELPGQPKLKFHYNPVSANYFAVTGARIVAGRGFAVADGAGATPVVLVSQAYTRRFSGGAAPLGQWIRVAGKDRQVVGVVEDGPSIHLRETIEPYFYFPEAQMPMGELTFFVAARDPAGVSRAVRAALRESAREFTVFDQHTLRMHMRGSRGEEEMAALLTGCLALLGLFLAAAGLFGVTMFAVARRTAEFGVRVAMGATPSRLAAQVLRQAAVRVAVAVPLGWLAAWAGRQSIQKLLFGVGAGDPATFAAASAVVALVACAATLGPALRAARIDPVSALRHE
jgi:predicted permease